MTNLRIFIDEGYRLIEDDLKNIEDNEIRAIISEGYRSLLSFSSEDYHKIQHYDKLLDKIKPPLRDGLLEYFVSRGDVNEFKTRFAHTGVDNVEYPKNISTPKDVSKSR